MLASVCFFARKAGQNRISRNHTMLPTRSRRSSTVKGNGHVDVSIIITALVQLRAGEGLFVPWQPRAAVTKERSCL